MRSLWDWLRGEGTGRREGDSSINPWAIFVAAWFICMAIAGLWFAFDMASMMAGRLPPP